MSGIRHITGAVGPEIITEIGTGLIIDRAAWSGPSVIVCKGAIAEAVDAGISRIFVIDHDLADRFTELFIENGNRLCQGAGDLFYVRDQKVIAESHAYLEPAKIRSWIQTSVSS